LLVLVLAEVHDLADRRIGVGSDLDEIEPRLSRDLERFGQRLGSKLRAVGSDQADLTSADAVVDTGVVCGQCGITSSGWRRRRCDGELVLRRRKRSPSRRRRTFGSTDNLV
jgi:hypothetical protein